MLLSNVYAFFLIALFTNSISWSIHASILDTVPRCLASLVQELDAGVCSNASTFSAAAAVNGFIECGSLPVSKLRVSLTDLSSGARASDVAYTCQDRQMSFC